MNLREFLGSVFLVRCNARRRAGDASVRYMPSEQVSGYGQTGMANSLSRPKVNPRDSSRMLSRAHIFYSVHGEPGCGSDRAQWL